MVEIMSFVKTVTLKGLLGVYSEPGRDPRFHTISTVFIARGEGDPSAGDDADDLKWIDPKDPLNDLAFDHKEILAHFSIWLERQQYHKEKG